ncbi:RDD family protein [Thalassobacillus sp. CUG 92003]|uniref:RDD family protein n=1 Tax=Thalassobacillus sp. CUG 92003 TaxID=2736641 RepID=UPI0015E63520|nr:RDD family protein [Thalassobacillus sp. CUG 92003]
MYRSVGFLKRLGAGLLDGLIIGLPLSILTGLVFGFGNDRIYSPFDLISLLYGLSVPVLWQGYMIGKRIVGIRIVKTDGSNVTFLTMVMRLIVGSLAYMATLGIGIIVSAFMVGFRHDNRAIHDFIAGTYVTEATPREMDEKLRE